MSTVATRLAEMERRTNQNTHDIYEIYDELTDHGHQLRRIRRQLDNHGRQLRDHGRQLRQLRRRVDRIQGEHGGKLDWLTTVVSGMAVHMGLAPPPLPEPEPMAEGEEE